MLPYLLEQCQVANLLLVELLLEREQLSKIRLNGLLRSRVVRGARLRYLLHPLIADQMLLNDVVPCSLHTH